jgi:hypothetical protein
MTPTPNQDDILKLVKLMRPWAMRSTPKVRIGNDYDGGYVLPSTVLTCDAVLSVGVGPDVSFDLALAQRGARVFQFDHTVIGVPEHQKHGNFIFEKKGWGSSSEGDFLTLEDMLSRLNAVKPQRSLFKFDIEGAEYEVLDACRPEHFEGFSVIACEIHDLDKLTEPLFFASVRRSLEKLNAHHVPVHLHANNYQSMILVGGIPIPKVLELSFLRKDLDHFPNISSDPIPGPLDRPNRPGVPDICMNPF